MQIYLMESNHRFKQRPTALPAYNEGSWKGGGSMIEFLKELMDIWYNTVFG